MSVVTRPYTLQERHDHAIKALSAILERAEGISRPNGTTNVIARIANAGVTGKSIDEAAARARPNNF